MRPETDNPVIDPKAHDERLEGDGSDTRISCHKPADAYAGVMASSCGWDHHFGDVHDLLI
jgi:hypothetical protein